MHEALRRVLTNAKTSINVIVHRNVFADIPLFFKYIKCCTGLKGRFLYIDKTSIESGYESRPATSFF
jgi:hypothetical protein